VTWPRPFLETNNQGLLLRLSLWIGLPNFAFVALHDPEILGGTLKNFGVTWQDHDLFCKYNYGDLFRLSLWIETKTWPNDSSFWQYKVCRYSWGFPGEGTSNDSGVIENIDFQCFRTTPLRQNYWGHHYYIVLFSPLLPFHWPRNTWPWMTLNGHTVSAGRTTFQKPTTALCS